MSSDPLCSLLSDIALLVMKFSGELGFLKLGDEKWTLMTKVPRAPFDDIVSYKSKFYGSDYDGRLVMFDSSLNWMEIVHYVPYAGGRKTHLVESFGDLLLVSRFVEHDITHHILIFKLNEQEHCWDKVRSLGDIVLFLGEQCSFSIRAREFHGSNGNCIYFKDKYFYTENVDNDGMREVFTNRTFVFKLSDCSIGPLEALPGYSDIFWPPANSL